MDESAYMCMDSGWMDGRKDYAQMDDGCHESMCVYMCRGWMDVWMDGSMMDGWMGGWMG